jgi:hypothetical protein
VESGDPSRSERSKRSLGPSDEEIADARRNWRPPLGPYLLKHGLIAALASLGWVLWTSLGWTAFLISWVILMVAVVLIRTFFMWRWGKGHNGPLTDT